MHRVTPVEDKDIQFEVKVGDNVVTEWATDIMVLWDDSLKGHPLNERYMSLRDKLSQRWGTPVTLGTAYLVLDTAVSMIAELKKTHLD
jgi:hypothetical protein